MSTDNLINIVIDKSLILSGVALALLLLLVRSLNVTLFKVSLFLKAFQFILFSKDKKFKFPLDDHASDFRNVNLYLFFF